MGDGKVRAIAEAIVFLEQLYWYWGRFVKQRGGILRKC